MAATTNFAMTMMRLRNPSPTTIFLTQRSASFFSSNSATKTSSSCVLFIQTQRRTFSSSSSSSSPSPGELIVIGGNGFVGSTICRRALDSGLSVTSINRSGSPKQHEGEAWVRKVNWISADALNVDSWSSSVLQKTPKPKAVISCLGTFGSDELMFKINGEANVKLAEKSKQAGISRFIYISVHNYHEDGSLPSKLDAGVSEQGWGYFRGKRFTEERLRTLFQEEEGGGREAVREDGGLSYYILRPSMISGTRVLPNGTKIPLWLMAKPLQWVTKLLPEGMRRLPIIGAAMVPPVSADDVARVAVQLVVNPAKYDWAKKTHVVNVDMMLKS